LEVRDEVNLEANSHGTPPVRRHDRSLSLFDTIPACDSQTVRHGQWQMDGFIIVQLCWRAVMTLIIVMQMLRKESIT